MSSGKIAHTRQRGRLLGVALCALAVMGTDVAEGAGTYYFNQADVNLGRILQGATPTATLTVARGVNGNDAASVSYTAGLSGPASFSANGGQTPAPITVTVLNIAAGSAAPFTGDRTWTASITSNLTSGQDGSVNINARVLAR